ncbi:hypothetical protein [Xanthomonas arboricola]
MLHGFAMFHDRLFEPCVELLAALIAKQRGCAPADEHTVAALGIFGMLFIFRSASSSCARLIPDGIDKTAHRIVLSNAIR